MNALLIVNQAFGGFLTAREGDDKYIFKKEQRNMVAKQVDGAVSLACILAPTCEVSEKRSQQKGKASVTGKPADELFSFLSPHQCFACRGVLC